jgi:hypothetical protein
MGVRQNSCRLLACVCLLMLTAYSVSPPCSAKNAARSTHRKTLDQQIEDYLWDLTKSLKWELPSNLGSDFYLNLASGTGTVSTATIEVGADGRITRAEITEPFGYKPFDDLARKSLKTLRKRGRPFPAGFPKRIRAKLLFAVDMANRNGPAAITTIEQIEKLQRAQ